MENINPKSDMPFPLPSHNCTCLLSSPPSILVWFLQIYSHGGIVNKVKGYFSTSQNRIHLEYEMKNNDSHRWRWETGDWTDDSDQMILILQSLLDNKGKVKNFNINTVIWSSKFGLVLEGNWLQIKSFCTECQWSSLNIEWKLYWPCGLSAACTLGSRPRALGLTLCDISVGCSWTRHCTRTLSLSTQKLYWAVNCLETW